MHLDFATGGCVGVQISSSSEIGFVGRLILLFSLGIIVRGLDQHGFRWMYLLGGRKKQAWAKP